MNILIPHSWLLDHLDTDATPQEIQELLSLSGPSVERVIEKDGEFIYDMEITTNRVDSLSVRGIAREAAVILKQNNKKAELRPLQLPTPKPTQTQLPLPKITNDPNVNGRTICIILANVQQTATPDWMAHRLRLIDLNVHNSAIDITNYVTHDLGHPCHAFDYDKLMATGGEINIVEAQPNETFMTLDGLRFTTVGGEVVFKNGKNEIIDLPSIKGTANTSIDSTTKNVLLLMESIRADKVRFASMTHNIRTVAAQLMEKSVDPNLAQDVLFKACQQYQELCSARIASEVYDDFPAKANQALVHFPLSELTRYLGMTIPTTTVTSILSDLGCLVTTQNDSVIDVTPPTYRPDLTTPADIVEEVARMYGYQNIPNQLMASALPLNPPKDQRFDLEAKLKTFLAHTGWQEVYTYSMVSETLALASGFSLEDHVRILNPLSDDRVYLRRSLIPSLIEALDANPLQPQLATFELAHAYHPVPNQLPIEELRLTLVSRRPYREVRGIIESLLSQLHLDQDYVIFSAISQDFVHNEQISTPSDTLLIGQIEFKGSNQTLLLGQVSILKTNVVAIDLDVASVFSVARSHPIYHPIAKTSPLVEDLTFTFPKHTPIGEVIKQMKEEIAEISNIQLASSFRNNVTFTIKYFDPKINMSNDRVEPLRQQLVYAVEKKWQASLVGTI
ncbi:MAG TPA: phenylalanine--tRNA ligase subunit beta [Candidatus Woesebacteria bacterium]|nr:phenylalanine--tRNA ligase subunit beta [Candidatus Woesebacteria bacterium]